VPAQNAPGASWHRYLYVQPRQSFSSSPRRGSNTLHVPQGPFYDFLAKYGAGRELQKLEQLNAVLSCGSYGRMNYGPDRPVRPARIRQAGTSKL